MKKIITVLVLATMPFFILAQAYATTSEDFIEKASVAGEFEIQSSELALDRSQNDAVKEFAKKMISDHKDAGAKLKDTVKNSKKDMSLVKTELDGSHQSLIHDLERASDEDFDKKYIDIQTDAHKEAVALFEDYSKNGDDKKLKAFASKTLPTLKGHLDHVKQLGDKNEKADNGNY